MYDSLPQQTVQASPSRNVVRRRRKKKAALSILVLLSTLAVVAASCTTYLRYSGHWDVVQAVLDSVWQRVLSAWQWLQARLF